MSGWDDTPAAPGGDWGGGFQADTSGGGWGADNTNGGRDMNEADTEFLDNMSKHAGGAPADGGCRNCGADGHFARDCPEPKAEGMNSGLCYNCNQPGHNKADCPNEAVEREFTGECRVCGQAGHRASDCPNKIDTCRACKQVGHKFEDCMNNRVFASLGITKDVTPEDGWIALKKADEDKDVDDIKQTLLEYAKALPETTLVELENAFRAESMNTHLVAVQQEISITHTIVSLQGNPNQKFVMTIQWSIKPRRKKFAEGWPANQEENLTRLAEAGFVLDGLVTKCDRCGELGHTQAKCEQEKEDIHANTALVCHICNEDSHRARDCKQPRKKPGAKGCRNCGSEEHIAKECPEPPNPENVECRNCNQTGHFSRDCPEREPEICRNCNEEGHRAKDCEKERVIICRNCDAEGHVSRECPKPRDYSRVECSNCHQKGHTMVRCKEPKADAEAGGDGGYGGGGAGHGAGADDFGGGDATAGGNDFAPPAATGGWDSGTGGGGW